MQKLLLLLISLHLQLCALDLSGGKLLDLSKSQLEQLANKGWSRASMQAQSILNFAFDGTYRRPAMFPDDIQAKPLIEITENQEVEAAVVEEMDILTLQPNPAKDQVQLSFKLPEGKQEAILKVIDLQGRLLYSSSIQENQNEHSLNVSNWTAGQYYVFLEGKNWRSASVGLVIVK